MVNILTTFISTVLAMSIVFVWQKHIGHIITYIVGVIFLIEAISAILSRSFELLGVFAIILPAMIFGVICSVVLNLFGWGVWIEGIMVDAVILVLAYQYVKKEFKKVNLSL